MQNWQKWGIPSASINSFVYRGNSPQQLHIPWLLITLNLEDEWTTKDNVSGSSMVMVF